MRQSKRRKIFLIASGIIFKILIISFILFNIIVVLHYSVSTAKEIKLVSKKKNFQRVFLHSVCLKKQTKKFSDCRSIARYMQRGSGFKCISRCVGVACWQLADDAVTASVFAAVAIKLACKFLNEKKKIIQEREHKASKCPLTNGVIEGADHRAGSRCIYICV